MDATGAIRLNLPGLFVWRDEQRRTPKIGVPDKGPKLSGKAGIATQALLREPRRAWSIQDLAHQAGASTGLVHRLLVRLEQEQLIEAQGTGPNKTRVLMKPGPLLDLWAEEMRDRGLHKVRAFRLARDPRQQMDGLGSSLTELSVKHAISGAAAAMRLAPFLTAVPVTDVWVGEEDDLERVARAIGAEPVTEGHNVVLRSARDDTPLAFRTRHDGVWLADVFRVYLDVRSDPQRGREQAARLREEAIGF
jgi:hypothetical protein